MPTIYELIIAGQLDPLWSEWLEGMTIEVLENGTTLISGPVADQTALYGLLNRLRDMNLKLLAVMKKEDLP